MHDAFRRLSQSIFATVLVIGASVAASPAAAVIDAFKQAVAEAASENEAVATFYRERNYAPLWTGAEHQARRAALLYALDHAEEHALPSARYDLAGLKDQLRATRTNRARGFAEVAMTRVFLDYARDIQSGILVPGRAAEGIERKAPVRDAGETLVAFSESDPRAFLRSLPPQSAEYARLMKEKRRLEKLVAQGGWGATVPGGKLEPGDTGARVVALRDRLITLGYLRRSASDRFDTELERAVQRFQADHGLEPDGVAGEGTLAEINTPAVKRLEQVVVAMERERWTNFPRGERHIMVNLTDFTAKIVDRGKVTFQTRSVVGKNVHDQRSPEFSDEMEHMIINPSWHVPRSIATKEYLPMLKENPYAVQHLILTDVRGQQVNRGAVDFTQFDTRNFPFDMRQPPSRSNALGLVKFMFPNRHNIYLHDTPHKSLFKRERRAFSHGCIRLNDPFDFAYALLAVQTENPESFFQAKLASGVETKVDLNVHVPVHIMYRTAFTTAKGGLQHRRDVYGRDAQVFTALRNAGVVLRAAGS